MQPCSDAQRGRRVAAPTTEQTRPWTRRELLARTGAAVGGAAALSVLGGSSMSEALPSPQPEEFDAEVATAWFDLALSLVRSTPGFSPPVASRAFAYAGITLYEAVVPGSHRYRSLAGVLPGLPHLPKRVGHVWAPAVANSALAGIVRSLFATTGDTNQAAIDTLEVSFDRRFQRRLSPSRLCRSVGRGRDVARAIFDWSRGDGGHEGYLRNFPSDYVPPVGAALWVPAPPAFQPALQPTWGTNRCLALVDGAACPPGDATPYSEEPNSLFHAEAIEVYDAVNRLTPEQAAIALFWSDDPGVTATPPGHSISIATQVLRAEDASLMTAAEAYAKVGIAVCDAFIACWNAKYHHHLLRPVTYIRRLIDADWVPPLVTPPFPEYTSGHSVQSGAAFGVLSDLFGDHYRFTDHTHDVRGLSPRHFASFSHAAREAAVSRLYGGIHFRPAIVNGLAQGRCIADAVNALAFTRRR